MKFAILSVTVVVYLSLKGFFADTVKKQITKEVNICKRDDPQMEKCYCNNFNRLIPIVKNGEPEMNLIPLEPLQVEHLQMDLPEFKNVYFRTDLFNVTLHGMSLGRALHCNAYMTEDGAQMAYDFVFPKIELKSKYKANGKFFLLGIHGTGDFHGNFSGLVMSSIWNSTRFMKHGKDHLNFTTKFTDLTIKKFYFHFTNLFGNNTALNENMNDFLNTNADLLYAEIKPMVLKTIREVSLKIINDFYYTFLFDDLFPKN